jgi:hypothetical protein
MTTLTLKKEKPYKRPQTHLDKWVGKRVTLTLPTETITGTLESIAQFDVALDTDAGTAIVHKSLIAIARLA